MYIIRKRKDNKYEIRKKGSKRATKVFDTIEAAILYARQNNLKYEVAESTAKKEIKKRSKLFLVLFIILLVVIIALAVLYFTGNLKLDLGLDEPNSGDSSGSNNNNNQGSTDDSGEALTGIVYDDFQIHFLELGNDYNGDSVYIKAGETDILIDAGSRSNSSTAIKNYINQYVTDNKLEYVIITHGDQDHIAAFPGTSGIFSSYDVDTIIMNERTTKTTRVYQNLITSINSLVADGTNLYYVDDCWNNENGAKSTYILDEELNITMDILYNYYYFNDTSDENNYSVCTMFNYNDHHFMLTGDLELEGEEEMANYYDGSTEDKTLPHVDLFKAGHHGSKTSSNDCLLSLITPDIVCVCCCAGSIEYTNRYINTFPTQDMIDRVAKYTDAVYVTTYYDEKEKTAKPLNGTILVSCNGSLVAVSATNNTTKLKDTDWFNETIYVVNDIYITPSTSSDEYYTADTPNAKPVPRRVWPTN